MNQVTSCNIRKTLWPRRQTWQCDFSIKNNLHFIFICEKEIVLCTIWRKTGDSRDLSLSWAHAGSFQGKDILNQIKVTEDNFSEEKQQGQKCHAQGRGSVIAVDKEGDSVTCQLTPKKVACETKGQ